MLLSFQPPTPEPAGMVDPLIFSSRKPTPLAAQTVRIDVLCGLVFFFCVCFFGLVWDLDWIGCFLLIFSFVFGVSIYIPMSLIPGASLVGAVLVLLFFLAFLLGLCICVVLFIRPREAWKNSDRFLVFYV